MYNRVCYYLYQNGITDFDNFELDESKIGYWNYNIAKPTNEVLNAYSASEINQFRSLLILKKKLRESTCPVQCNFNQLEGLKNLNVKEGSIVYDQVGYNLYVFSNGSWRQVSIS